MFYLSWASEEAVAADVGALDRLLDGLSDTLRAEPTLVMVARGAPNGDSLSIGLGRNVSVLNSVPASLDPPYFTCRGNETGEGTVAFVFGNQLSEYPLRNAIPYRTARDAMRFFCETGSLSPDVEWEEV